MLKIPRCTRLPRTTRHHAYDHPLLDGHSHGRGTDCCSRQAHDIIRTGEAAYAHLGLSTETPDADLITAMVTHPELIERPLVVTPKGAILARPTDLIATIL